VRLLLDTHVLLWAAANSARLPREARNLLEDDNNDVYYSAASIWEIAIKGAWAGA
jgi:PIN domain nuclease of toxin-antitoxin system